MLAGMRHTAVLPLLGFVLVELGVGACSSTPGTQPDIEATVEAKAQFLAKAIVEATAQAVLTATPVSPSSAATPSPNQTPAARTVLLTPTRTPRPPTPSPTPNYKATVEALAQYEPTIEDYRIVIQPSIRNLTKRAQDSVLRQFDEHAGAYLASECLDEVRPSAVRFRSFVESVYQSDGSK